MALGKFPNVSAYLENWTNVIVAELRKSAIEQMNINKSKAKFPSEGDPEASDLVMLMRPNLKIFGDSVEAQIIMPSQWKWFEHGRGAGKMPPEEPIVKWIRHRGFPIDLSSIKKKLKKESKRLFATKGKIRKNKKLLRQYTTEQKRKQLAFLIRRKIGKEGTRATHFFSNVITEDVLNNLRNTLKDRFKKDVTITLIEEIKKEII